MEDYPRTLVELEARFNSEQACRDYLFRLRWPEGFRCPRCGGAKAGPLDWVGWRCANCARPVSVTAGTIFQDTHTPLTIGFRAMWWVVAQKNGVSALGVQRVLGLGSYQTAWAWLHKRRRAMVRPGRDRLTGAGEVDETYLGGWEEGMRGRQTEKKGLIVGAAPERGRGIGRIRRRRIADASAASVVPFVHDSVEPGRVVHPDGWLGYEPLPRKGYRHRITVLRGQEKSPSDRLPHVHRVISLWKRWRLGTHQGAVRLEHLDYLICAVYSWLPPTS